MLDMDGEQVVLGTKTGSKIYCVMHSPERSNGKAIVVCPGFSGTASNEEGFAIYGANRGYAVLAIDFFSHGNSPGRSVDLTISDELEDLKAALKFVSKKFSKIGIVGHSLGGLIACMGARDAGALVLWAPAIQIKNVWISLFRDERMNWPDADPVRLIEEKGYVEITRRWGFDNSGAPFSVGKRMWDEMCRLDWRAIVEGLDVPVKIIQAGMDGEPYVGFNREAFAAMKSKKEFETLDADHVFTGKRVQVYKSTIDWFDENL